MDLRVADTDQLLADQARALFEAEASPERLAGWEGSTDGFDPALWFRLVGLGWPALAVPEVAGGGGGTLGHLGVLATEIGRAAFPSPFLAVAGAGLVTARLAAGPARLTKRASALLEGIARDGAVAGLVWTPGCGSKLSAVRGGSSIRLSGRVVTEWAHLAETLVCLAPLPAGEVAALAVDPRAPGVAVEPRRSFDNERVAVVTFDGIDVEEADHLVPGGAVPSAEAIDVLGALRLIRAAELCGIAERILALTATYVSNRMQFGVPLGTFQAVQHASADVATLVHGARLATDEGLSTADRGGPAADVRRAGAVAAWLAGRAAVAAAVTGAQLHGGIGMIRDYPLHFYYRRAKAMQLRLGSAVDQLEEVAQTLVDPVALTGGAPAPWL